MILKINGTDVSTLVKSFRVGYETLVSSDSGRNANGDTVIDVVNQKVKLYVTFRAMEQPDMNKVMAALSGYVIPVTYRDSKTGSEKTITCYHGTPEPEYYFIHSDRVLFKDMNLNFIEL
jgi:hypothetical protein